MDPKRGAPVWPPKKKAHVHRFLGRYTDKESTRAMTSSTPTPFGDRSAPLSTPPSTPILSGSSHICTISSPSTPLSSPSSRPASSTPASSTPTSATPASTTPASTTTASTTPVATSPSSNSVANEPIEQHGYLLGSILPNGCLVVGIRAKLLNPSGKCAAIISKTFLERVDPSGCKWSAISPDTQLFYWEEFQKRCYWDASLNSSVKTAWEDKAKERYTQYIYNMKINPTHRRPRHVSEEVWTAWEAIWNTEEFKEKSDKNKENRLKGAVCGRALPTHNGGSASHLKIADELEKILGKPPSDYDIFAYTHTTDHDGKSFIVEKAQQVNDKFMSLRDDLVAIGEEVDDSNLYYEVVGGHDRKRRLYGLGSYGKSIVPTTNSFESCTSQDPNAYKDEINTKIQKLEEIVEQQQLVIQGLSDMVKDFTSK